MKSILFIIPSMSPAGGIERVISTLVNKLSELYECDVLTFDNKDYFYHVDKNVGRHTLNQKLNLDMNHRWRRLIQVGTNFWITIFNLKRFFSTNVYDYVYVTHPLVHLILLLAGVNSRKIIISEHGARNNYNKIYRFIRKVTYKHCHAYCLPTKSDFAFYKEMGFPVRYTPHYKPNLKYRMHADDVRTVLCVGRLTPDKQHLLLLDIWRECIHQLPKGWLLHIVGDGELKPDIEKFITNNKLEDNVKLSCAVRDVSDLYYNSSIFVLTSRSEGFGMVLLEAISFGLPAISFNCPSGPMDIINGENGFLIEDGNRDLFKNKLIELINSDELQDSLSTGAYKSAQQWNDEKITEYWQDIFK
ncbi:glycosyltransferase family 4 protein [Enterobacter sp. N18-03635]|uniref:glycosyltransferase family 4 protein n=1 Tax=Enterobacter sp. N18-03635 TaxID=2500132 RepID=UPI000FD99DBA|nr:glycosyltransferase family 4 protein [Enterobacter sp. N18-03635]AZV06352.1 glycosyltransferase family 4 protein [Enterobacter sp. N18-03635]